MMHHHLSRLLKHRLLPPFAASLSTSPRRPYARRTKSPSADPPPPASAATASAVGDGAVDKAPAAADGAAAWQREKPPGDPPRPTTVPFQPRVANLVRLVGTVGAPVQMQRTPDGRFSAISVLVQDRRLDFPKFWIPIIFQDDLAQVAASHLKENDLVYVSGQLTGDVPPFKLTDGQANIQVLANCLQFVDSKATVTDVTMNEEEEGFTEVVEYEKKFEPKRFTPKYPPVTVSGNRSKAGKLNELWNDVLARPHDWVDNRPEKKNGSRSAKYPDFKNKVSDVALWLDSAPTTVLEKLDDLTFSNGYGAVRRDKLFSGDTQKGFGTNWTARNSQHTSTVSKHKLEEDLWRDLVSNPMNWWDNRSDKPTPKHPDFKHKESGKGLWIGTMSPQWAVDVLPSLKFKGPSRGLRSQETLLS